MNIDTEEELINKLYYQFDIIFSTLLETKESEEESYKKHIAPEIDRQVEKAMGYIKTYIEDK